jgi:SAM-dependent methyltransferase
MGRFAKRFAIDGNTRVLDVGGTPGNWELLEVRPRLVILNMPRAGEAVPAGIGVVFGDGCSLPFASESFDIVFSNSVIEHVGSEERQRTFAEEVRRVGRRYFVQTPNRWFPLEHHLLTPFLHWLPLAWQRHLVRFNFWQWIARPRADEREFYLRHYIEDIRLLDATRMRELFPGAKVRRERFMGMTKSLIAERGP